VVVDVVRRLVEHRLPKLVVAVLQDTRRRPIRFVPVPVRKRQGHRHARRTRRAGTLIRRATISERLTPLTQRAAKEQPG
jgi:hypothetical protein